LETNNDAKVECTGRHHAASGVGSPRVLGRHPWDKAKQPARLRGSSSWGPPQPVRDHRLPQSDQMNDFFVSYLDTIDQRLLEYLDEDDELSL
jgi:hypothetical protein